MPHPTPESERPNAMVFLVSKYSLIISTAGTKVMPRPLPIRRLKVKNKYSMVGA